MKTNIKKYSLQLILGALLLVTQSAGAADRSALQMLKAGWEQPARTYKPHTRWWWPGNVLTKGDITWQMEQMAAQGMGGVEICSTWKMYEKGNVEYLTPEFLELLKHAVAEGKRLDLDVAITFSPGWTFGGGWVPKADQSKVLCMGGKELAGDSTSAARCPSMSPRAGARKRPAEPWLNQPNSWPWWQGASPAKINSTRTR